MRNVIAALAVSFILLVCTFAGIGGSFDRQFWVAFLPGLMENLVILAAGVLIFDAIFKKERLDKLEQTNERQSRFVLLINNRLAFKILEHLGLATTEEFGEDPKLDFAFALDRLKTINLANIFYEKLMGSENREVFAESFEKILSRESEGISKALDNVYPRPDPTLKVSDDQLLISIAALGALVTLIRAFREANAQVAVENQLKPEHLNLLIKIGYRQIGTEMQRI